MAGGSEFPQASQGPQEEGALSVVRKKKGVGALKVGNGEAQVDGGVGVLEVRR